MQEAQLIEFIAKAETRVGAPFSVNWFLKNPNGDVIAMEGSVTELNEQSEEQTIAIVWNQLGTAIETPVQGKYDLVERVRNTPPNTQADEPPEGN